MRSSLPLAALAALVLSACSDGGDTDGSDIDTDGAFTGERCLAMSPPCASGDEAEQAIEDHDWACWETPHTLLELTDPEPRFIPADTSGLDEGGGISSCCYTGVWVKTGDPTCVIGRPLRDGDTVCTAPVVRGPARCARPGLSPSDRAALVDHHTTLGQLEHASVAAFDQVLAFLEAHGAPAHLLRRTRAARADEVRHAQLALDLAGELAGEVRTPGALAVPAPPWPDLAAFAAATVVEGCVGETLAAVQALAQRAAATDPAAVHLLDTIATDESRHAALAWATVAWCLSEGGEAVASAVDRAFDRAIREAGPHPAPEAVTPTQRAFGQVDRATLARAVAQGLAQVVGPAWAALRAGTDAEASPDRAGTAA